IIFLCSSDCSMEYKKANAVMSLCEYCKIEKITREAKRINNKDCFFCSDGCKLLFRHELSKNWGKHCHSCVYCHCVSKKLVTAQYGGSVEEFCSEDCRSKYTIFSHFLNPKILNNNYSCSTALVLGNKMYKTGY
uniref:Zinc finger MYM-type containing 4 n=1 Tax=Fundulus heteroclitus TaxID=8078 RepID=A0A3Q2PMC0_FUNHE